MDVLVEGKRATAALDDVLDDATIVPAPPGAVKIASLQGIAVAGAYVIRLADRSAELLLANDKGLIDVARSHGVECWWVTTLLLRYTKERVVTAEEATSVLYDLVEAGMNLHPKVYARVQKTLEDLEP